MNNELVVGSMLCCVSRVFHLKCWDYLMTKKILILSKFDHCSISLLVSFLPNILKIVADASFLNIVFGLEY